MIPKPADIAITRLWSVNSFIPENRLPLTGCVWGVHLDIQAKSVRYSNHWFNFGLTPLESPVNVFAMLSSLPKEALVEKNGNFYQDFDFINFIQSVLVLAFSNPGYVADWRIGRGHAGFAHELTHQIGGLYPPHFPLTDAA